MHVILSFACFHDLDKDPFVGKHLVPYRYGPKPDYGDESSVPSLVRGLYNLPAINSATVIFPLLISSYFSPIDSERLTKAHFHLLLWCDRWQWVLLSAPGQQWATHSQCDGVGHGAHRARRALTISQKPRAHQTPFILSRLTEKYVNIQAVSSQAQTGKTLLKNSNCFTRKADRFGVLHSLYLQTKQCNCFYFKFGKRKKAKNLIFLLNLPLADFLSSPLIPQFSPPSSFCPDLHWKCSHLRPSLQLSIG